MSSEYSRTVAVTCERCQSKMQLISEMLLLTCDPRPVNTEEMLQLDGSYVAFKKEVSLRLKDLSKTIQSIASQVQTVSVVWADMSVEIQNLSDCAILIMECCCSAAYFIAVNFQGSVKATPGIIDKYQLSRAGIELKLSCTRLKRSRSEDITSQVLVDVCSSISKALSVMTDCCKNASENAKDSSDQDLFKLSLKSVTSSASCLLASVKSFQNNSSPNHLNRVISFCDPVITASHALVAFATEEEFFGIPAELTSDARESQKCVLGACMSIVSGSIQMSKSIRDLAFDMINTKHRERVALCTDSIERSSVQLLDLLDKYDYSENNSIASNHTTPSTPSPSSTMPTS
ncbi:hypothetical protein LOTGIDRAFT_135570 [Lottia gigantea]|uniref:Talin IBS2B domain-containing protein n=1 Tax=Lottia gigantea TaxID=225164 RepID=V3ZI25_LOTGI|nr:hypothetical protein LOTGIDRAFT_135570 [Lottia gigantea]ESO81965.1 hypothetical protein LOTGIDRAFT_135570 [Lottia gigantea]